MKWKRRRRIESTTLLSKCTIARILRWQKGGGKRGNCDIDKRTPRPKDEREKEATVGPESHLFTNDRSIDQFAEIKK